MQHHDKILGTLSFTSVHKEEFISSPALLPNTKKAVESNLLHKFWLVTCTLTGTQLSMQFRSLKLFPDTQCEIVSGLVPLRGLNTFLHL